MGSSEDMAIEKDGKRNSLFDHCKIATNGYKAIITKVDGPRNVGASNMKISFHLLVHL
jgi:hypothetical protein